MVVGEGTQPQLTRHDVAGTPDGVVLMLHGGTANSLDPVDDRSASWRRSRWMMGQIADRLHEAGWGSGCCATSSVAGTPGSLSPSPVPDARWALDEVRRELGELPVVLLGHSMGARTAVAVADDPLVQGVVALAPWLPADEPVAPLAGKHLPQRTAARTRSPRPARRGPSYAGRRRSPRRRSSPTWAARGTTCSAAWPGGTTTPRAARWPSSPTPAPRVD